MPGAAANPPRLTAGSLAFIALVALIGGTSCSLQMEFDPKPVHASRLALGYHFSCSLTLQDRAVACWGSNTDGALGHDGVDAILPEPNANLAGGFDQITAGDGHACALSDGALTCWGNNQNRQVGPSPPTFYDTPLAVMEATQVSQVSAGMQHTCVVAQGRVLCWGDNSSGQLGRPMTEATSEIPVAVAIPGDPGIERVAAGGQHTCAQTSDGRLWCWGDNSRGQLGHPTSEAVSEIPVSVTIPGDPVVELVARGGQTCARTGDGELYCWGDNWEGQCGQDNQAEEDRRIYAPALVPRPAGAWEEVAMGGWFTCARTGGRVYCWGSHAEGALGIGEPWGTDAGGPTPQLALIDEVTHIAAGFNHACALVGATSQIWCWGSNQFGQIGGTGPFREVVATPEPLLWQ